MQLTFHFSSTEIYNTENQHIKHPHPPYSIFYLDILGIHEVFLLKKMRNTQIYLLPLAVDCSLAEKHLLTFEKSSKL